MKMETSWARLYGAKSLALALSIAGALFASGCSSDDEGGGGGGGQIDGLAKAACDQEAASCQEDSFCVERHAETYGEAEVFDCAAQFTALLKCMSQAEWMCTASEYFDGPEACSAEANAYDECTPSYGYSGAGTSCSGSLYKGDVEYSADCSGKSCTCTNGEKEGATFTISECGTIPVWGGIKANCH